ncbi:Type III restriction-modification system methylation subunit [Chitinispirillum alkaliphilum]|nr:Type III restriction-modification system methylation subunit [Chitinispirillum alkaliphilum]
MSKYDELVGKLREIFQIDRPELDFGIYRIINARSKEINDYLENKLRAQVAQSLAFAGNANQEHLQSALSEAIKNAEGLGVQPDEVPKVQELRKQLYEQSSYTSEHENAVFSHLLTFFSRYYDNGDFISQRRYKGDTYAIPYAGEEVVLHWANKDQYYTKSGENFSNYSFKLDDGRKVHFRLISADTAKDNRKDNDKERRFVLTKERTVVRSDEDGEEYEENIIPVEEIDGELVIRFEYRAMPKGSKQDALVNDAVAEILANNDVKSRWLDLGRREPTEKNPARTLLEKHLGNYTTKNTADYFIHKDLGRFLRGELDFYIKSELMHLDDVQNAQKFADIEKNLRMIQCLRAIALDLITFLAQLEDFQKKLWLKKKFVVSTHYCITLDRVPEELFAEIADNKKQWEQWESLGMVSSVKKGANGAPKLELGATIGTVEYLKENTFLMVDTALFGGEFKAKLLSGIDNLDENVDGVLFHGDNFQALELLQERYREQVKCIYIDPPYNAKSTEILYKNTYKHSSWLTLLKNRIEITKGLMQPLDGIFVVAIDEVEQEVLGQILSEEFPEHQKTCITVVHNATGQQGNNFSYINEFAYGDL